jgi:hypothetical protein
MAVLILMLFSAVASLLEYDARDFEELMSKQESSIMGGRRAIGAPPIRCEYDFAVATEY